MHELEQVLVQREQAQKTSGDGGVLVCFGGALFAYFLRELGYVLAGEVLDFEEVDWDTAAVSTAGPLGVLPATLVGDINLKPRTTYHLSCPLIGL